MNTTPKPPPGSANSSPKATSHRVSSTPATSSSSSQLTLWATPSATSSPASAAGPSPSSSPASPPPPHFGQAPALVSHSQSQARASGRQTRVTFGRSSAVSSASAALQSSLASRLRQRLAASGSPEYVLTWKHWPIAQQPPICALRGAPRTAKSGFCVAIRPLPGNAPPSPPHTSASASGGALADWRSPDHNQRGGSYADPEKALARLSSGHQINLEDQVVLVGWTTPQAHDSTGRSPTQKDLHGKKHGCKCLALDAQEVIPLADWATPTVGNADGSQQAKDASPTGRRPDGSKATVSLNQIAQLAGWPTPQTTDAPNMSQNRGADHGGCRARQTPQSVQGLVGWATPTVQDSSNNAGPSQFRRNSLPLNCEVTLVQGETVPPGPTSTSSPVATAKRGALNPAHSRWLMGYPAACDSCGATAMQSCRKERQTSSKPLSKPSTKGARSLLTAPVPPSDCLPV